MATDVAAPEALQEETAALLTRLIRFDTVNPPGNERAIQELLMGILSDAGFECELAGELADRPNLIARLRGHGEGKTLCYLAHVDTVLAHPEEWSVDPWSGTVKDGYLWGRGALDMKGQVAAEVIAATTLAKSGWRPPAGELLVVLTCDEEAGARRGAQWLCREVPEKVRADYVVNEGAGEVFEFDGRRYYGVACGEKGVFRFKLVTDGVAGHGSVPKIGDNALLKMAPFLEAFRERQSSFERSPEVDALFELLLGERPADDAALAGLLARVEQAEPRLAFQIEPMLGVTAAPTTIRASEQGNVIPSRAELLVDCRVPPGRDTDHARRKVEEIVGTEGHALDFDISVVGNRSPLASPLMDELQRFVTQHDPGALVAPVVMAGFSDSHWWRKAFPECVAYGFFPQRAMTIFETRPLMHSADERIALDDLGFATTFFCELAPRVLG